MADPYYYTRDIFDIQNQRRALGQSGAFSPSDITTIMGQNFYQQQVVGEREREYQLAQQRQQFAEKEAERAQGEASKAARRGAYFQGAQLAVNVPLAYGAAKQMGWVGGGTGDTAPYGTPGGGTTGATGQEAAISGSEAGAGTAIGTSAGYAPATSAAGIPGYAPAIGGEQAAITGTAGAGGAEAGAAGASAGQATITGAGGMSAGTVAGGAALGAAGVAASSWITGREFEKHGLSEMTGRILGAAFPMITGPAAAATHAVEKIFGGSIICTELNRQGLLDKTMLKYSTIYVLRYSNPESYNGYLMFARPIVELMKKSKIVTYLMIPYGKTICRECASRTNSNKYKSNWFSKLVYEASDKFYNWYYNREMKKICGEVKHA